jgi:hypothetical protein
MTRIYIEDTSIAAHINRKMDTKSNEVPAFRPSNILLTEQATEAEHVVKLSSFLWSIPEGLVAPTLSEMPQDRLRVSHLSELLELSDQVLQRGDYLNPPTIVKQVLSASFDSLRANPVHPKMFRSDIVFPSEAVRLPLRELLLQKLSGGKGDQLTEQTLANVLTHWETPGYLSIQHLEQIVGLLSEKLETLDLAQHARQTEANEVTSNLIEIGRSVVNTLSLLHGEGHNVVEKVGLKVHYTDPLPEFVIDHVLLTAKSADDLHQICSAAYAMIKFGASLNWDSKPVENESHLVYEGLDFPMVGSAMHANGTNIVKRLIALSMPVSEDSRSIVSAYGVDKLILGRNTTKLLADFQSMFPNENLYGRS